MMIKAIQLRKPYSVVLILIVLTLIILTGIFWQLLSVVKNRPQYSLINPGEPFLQALSDAPCVAEICPGMKNTRELISNANAGGLIAVKESALPYPPRADFHTANGERGTLHMGSDIVYAIHWQLSNVSLTPETLIDVFGPPDEVVLLYECSGHWGTRVVGAFLYIERGIEVTTSFVPSDESIAGRKRRPPGFEWSPEKAGGFKMTVTGEEPVMSIRYVNPEPYHERLANLLMDLAGSQVKYDYRSQNPYPEYLALFTGALQPWAGFGQSYRAADFCGR